MNYRPLHVRVSTTSHRINIDFIYWLSLIISMLYSTLSDRAYQPTACVTYTSPQTEGKYHLANLWVTYSQHVETSNRCWLSRQGLSVQINSYTNFLRCWVDTDPHCRGRSGGHCVTLYAMAEAPFTDFLT